MKLTIIFHGYEIRQINVECFNKMLNLFEQDRLPEKAEKLYFFCEGKKFVGVDNSTGDMWTEEFNTALKCLRWLIGAFEAE